MSTAESGLLVITWRRSTLEVSLCAWCTLIACWSVLAVRLFFIMIVTKKIYCAVVVQLWNFQSRVEYQYKFQQNRFYINVPGVEILIASTCFQTSSIRKSLVHVEIWLSQIKRPNLDTETNRISWTSSQLVLLVWKQKYLSWASSILSPDLSCCDILCLAGVAIIQQRCVVLNNKWVQKKNCL